MQNLFRTTFKDGSTFDSETQTASLEECALRLSVDLGTLATANGFTDDNEDPAVVNVFRNRAHKAASLNGQADPFATIRPVPQGRPATDAEAGIGLRGQWMGEMFDGRRFGPGTGAECSKEIAFRLGTDTAQLVSQSDGAGAVNVWASSKAKDEGNIPAAVLTPATAANCPPVPRTIKPKPGTLTYADFQHLTRALCMNESMCEGALKLHGQPVVGDTEERTERRKRLCDSYARELSEVLELKAKLSLMFLGR